MTELKLGSRVFLVARDAHAGVGVYPEVVCRTFDQAVSTVASLTAKAFKDCNLAAYRIIEISEVAA